MTFENSPDDGPSLIPETERKGAIAQAYREILQRPVFLAIATTGYGFWSPRSEEILEICILESDRRVVFESLVKPRGAILPSSYFVHRITQRMVKHAPLWKDVLPQVSGAISGRRVALYDAERQLRYLKPTSALFDLPWTFDERKVFCVKRLYAPFNRKVYAGGLDSKWLGIWRAARQCEIPHDERHRARGDAELARAVLKHIASHFDVRPPKAPLKRPTSLRRWITHLDPFRTRPRVS